VKKNPKRATSKLQATTSKSKEKQATTSNNEQQQAKVIKK